MIPALRKLAEDNRLAICGKDFKTGQTLMKTIIAPGLKSRMLGLHGWYSTNIWETAMVRCWTILNRSRHKQSRSCQCWNIFCNRKYPALYKDFSHVVASTTTHRAGDNKEVGTTSTFLAGWDIRCRSN